MAEVLLGLTDMCLDCSHYRPIVPGPRRRVIRRSRQACRPARLAHTQGRHQQPCHLLVRRPELVFDLNNDGLTIGPGCLMSFANGPKETRTHRKIVT